MRLALLLTLSFILVGSIAHADSLPDVVFGTAQGHHAVLVLRDGRTLFGTLASYDARHAVLVDDDNGAIAPIAREDIAQVRLNDAAPGPAPQPRLLATRAPRLSLTAKIGLGLFAASYGTALVGGISYVSWNHVEIDRGRDAGDPSLYKQGYELVIPIVGPFLSAAASQGYPSGWQAGWIIDGVAQIAGLSVMIAGLVQQHAHAAPLSYRGATFTPSVTPQSIGLIGTF